MQNMSRSFYHYQGSLTTPRCDEIVNWFMVEDIQNCSAEQVGYFVARFNNSYRVVQNTSGRVVYHAKHLAPPVRVGSMQLVFILACVGLALLVILNCVHLFFKNLPKDPLSYNSLV